MPFTKEELDPPLKQTPVNDPVSKPSSPMDLALERYRDKHQEKEDANKVEKHVLLLIEDGVPLGAIVLDDASKVKQCKEDAVAAIRTLRDVRKDAWTNTDLIEILSEVYKVLLLSEFDMPYE